MTRADAAKEEERAFRCEKCHEAPGVVMFAQFWVCAHCKALIDAEVAYEAIPDKAGDR